MIWLTETVQALSTRCAHHTGASDFSYLVLSLEGPRWVIYTVRGKLGKGEDLPPGTMLNLKSMQEAGEEIYNLPTSDAEMKSVVESVYGELPEVQ